MVGKKVDEDGLNYIVWAKNNKLRHEDILAELANQEIEISSTRISQLYQKNKSDKSKGSINPYDPEVLNNYVPVSSHQHDTETPGAPHVETVNTDIPTFQTESGGTYMVDLKPILTGAGIRGQKNAQVIKVFENSPGTPRDLQETLDILGVGVPVQKQVVASAYGLVTMKEIYGMKSKVKNQSSIPNSNQPNAQQMVNSLIAQKVGAISNRVALKEAEATLNDLEEKNSGEKPESTFQAVKDIYALKALERSDGNNNNELINKLIIEKVKSEDSQLLKAIELMDKLRGSGTKEEDIKLKYLMDETKQLRENSERSKEQYLKSEKEKMTLILEQIQKEAARTQMSFEDYTNQIAHSVQLAEKMGMTKGGKSDQQDAINRLNAGTQMVETVSNKLDTGMDKLGTRIEGGISLLVQLFDKRDQRMEERLAKNNSMALRELPPREQTSVGEREQALNTIGTSLQNVEKLKSIHNRFSQIGQS